MDSPMKLIVPKNKIILFETSKHRKQVYTCFVVKLARQNVIFECLEIKLGFFLCFQHLIFQK